MLTTITKNSEDRQVSGRNRRLRNKVIGFYDYTVILTYLGLLSALVGMFCSFEGYFPTAIICLGIVLLCDTMDGRVARAKPNRTPQESLFGVQIDSLCDVISFGVFPSILFYCLGLNGVGDFIPIAFYCLCCVIRLGYFNVLATENDPSNKGVYHGLPVVCLSVLVPAAYMLRAWLPARLFLWLLRLMLLTFGVLYIADFRVRKPGVVKLAVMALVFFIPVAVIFIR